MDGSQYKKTSMTALFALEFKESVKRYVGILTFSLLCPTTFQRKVFF